MRHSESSVAPETPRFQCRLRSMPYRRRYFYRARKVIAWLKTSVAQGKRQQPTLAAKWIAVRALFACALKQLNQPVTALVELSETVHAPCDGKILAHLARQLLEQLAAECSLVSQSTHAPHQLSQTLHQARNPKGTANQYQQ